MCQECVDQGIMTEEQAQQMGPIIEDLMAKLAGRGNGNPMAQMISRTENAVDNLTRAAAEARAACPGQRDDEIVDQFAASIMFRLSHQALASLVADLGLHFLRSADQMGLTTDPDDDLGDQAPVDVFATRLADAADESDAQQVLDTSLGIVRETSAGKSKQPGMYL